MAEINKLSAAQVKAGKFEGRVINLADGGGLVLKVKERGKYWHFRYRFAGKAKMISFGVYPEVSLADARELRDAARVSLRNGIDPSAQRKARKSLIQQSHDDSFEAMSYEWMESVHVHKVSKSHADRSRRRLQLYAFPVIGVLPVSELTPADLLSVIRPIEARGKVETAHRVKSLCGQVLRYAVVTGRAETDISAGLRDVLRPSVKNHLPAVTDPKEIAHLMRAIYAYEGHHSTCAALKLLSILFVRPGELRSLRWQSLDLDRAEFSYQPSKNGSPLVVSLPNQAIDILKHQFAITGDGEFVFPSERSAKRPMSENTLNAALQRLGYKGKMVAHGFRAMARTLLAERLDFPIEVIEMQLAHAVRDANGRAYNRTSYYEQRKDMLQAWADYLDSLRLDRCEIFHFSQQTGS